MRTLLLFILAIGGVDAGTIHLKDGSTLKGHIEKIHHNKVSFRTVMGRLNIPIKTVTTFTTDKKLWFAHDHAGINREYCIVNYKEGAYILNPGQKNQRQVKTCAALWDKRIKDPFTMSWKREISLYYTAESGNTKSENIGGSFKSTFSRPTNRLNVIAKGMYYHRDKRELRNESLGKIDHEWDCDSRNSLYCMTLFQHDAIKRLKLRQAYGTGYGRYFIKSHEHNLRTRVGIQYRNDVYEDNTRWEGPALDMELMHYISNTDCGNILTKLRYSPAFDKKRNYKQLLFHETSWDIPITPRKWTFRLGLKNYYDEEPVNDRKHLDTQYYARLVYAW